MDVPVHVIAGTPLQNTYEKLIDTPLDSAHRPVVVCYICYALLRKSHNLMVRSILAERVLTQILSDDIAKGESIALLKQKAYGHVLLMTPVELIAIAGTEHNLIKEVIKEEPQYGEERETDRPASAECLMFEESEDEEDSKGELLEDVDIESQVLIDVGDSKQEKLDPLNISTPVEYIDTKKVSDGENIKTNGAEDKTSGTEHNLIKEEIKEEPPSQHDEERETDRPASAECLMFEESEDEGDRKRELLEDVDIESQVLMETDGAEDKTRQQSKGKFTTCTKH